MSPLMTQAVADALRRVCEGDHPGNESYHDSEAHDLLDNLSAHGWAIVEARNQADAAVARILAAIEDQRTFSDPDLWDQFVQIVREAALAADLAVEPRCPRCDLASPSDAHVCADLDKGGMGSRVPGTISEGRE